MLNNNKLHEDVTLCGPQKSCSKYVLDVRKAPTTLPNTMSIYLTLFLSLPLPLSRQQKIIYKSGFSYNIQLSELPASEVEQLFMVLYAILGEQEFWRGFY